MTKNVELAAWAEAVATQTKPDRIHWCDGSEAEERTLIAAMLEDGTLARLNPDTHPNCYLHRSDKDDVARVEHLTYLCTASKDDAGPNNNWMEPTAGHAKIDALFDGCMGGTYDVRHPVSYGAVWFALFARGR